MADATLNLTSSNIGTSGTTITSGTATLDSDSTNSLYVYASCKVQYSSGTYYVGPINLYIKSKLASDIKYYINTISSSNEGGN